MKLKSLEIKGFKSFGDKVTIHFDKGVTAIVGPNGSGKSNVVDAMRWVLGEQKTRLLRSEKMENIIFNGTKTRKPANLAEVSLSFENDKGILPTEYSTVTITRKLYRSGESEYLLNGLACRLKDINDLFLDTGIGPDSYAIIELNMVDDILKDRHNSIKMLLEEAAGISKYKIRKRQTFQKLEETDADLNRVNDLLFEIEKSLKQLESQAKKTDRYYRLKEEYRQLSTQLAIYSVRDYRERLDTLTNREGEQHGVKGRLQLELEEKEIHLQKIKSEVAGQEEQLETVRKALNEKILGITRLENEEKNRNERLGYLLERQNQLKLSLSQDEIQETSLKESILHLEEDRQREEAHLARMSSENNQFKEIAEAGREDYENSQQQIKELNQQVYALRSSINDLETRQAVRQTRLQSMGAELARLQQQQAETESRLKESRDEQSRLLPDRQEAETNLQHLKIQKLQSEESIRNSEEKVKELNLILQAEARKTDARNNEYQLTKNLLEQMEGFPESIRYLKKSTEKFKQAPLLSEIIICAEEAKVAIENYLEPYLNYFIVDQIEDAWEALRQLSDSAKGRANFFILSQLNRFQPPATELVPGTEPALQFIEENPKYQSLFQFLLGHVHLIRTDSNPQQLPEPQSAQAVLLSRQGHFLKQKYSLGGGSIGLFDGKRTGKFRNLEKLAEELRQQEQILENYRTQITEHEKTVAEHKTGLRELNQLIQQKESLFVQLSGQVNTLESNSRFLENSIARAAENLTKLESEISEINFLTEKEGELPEQSPEQMRKRLENLIQQLNVQQEQSIQLQKEVNEKNQAFNQQNILLLQQQNRIQNLIRDLGYKQSQIETLKKNREQYRMELTSSEEQSSLLLGGVEQAGSMLEALVQERIVLESEFHQAEKSYLHSKENILAAEVQIADLRKNKENTDEALQNVHDELNDLKLHMNSLKERLSIEFSIDLDELLLQEPDPEFNVEEMRPRTEQLRKRVNEFGPINPMALEQYKEIKERYDFIIKEKTDLQNAKDALLLTISEIDETAKTVFMEAFTQVRAHFIRVFRSLFTDDDNCDLVLSEPMQPLESDIQIIAQPKGKKPLSIHQLSGGEKTLTATALLFGIYLLKPAPFCIFDEVDAPLDDNNIDKFNNIIRTFSKESQFIIITHNKKTMSATEIIYGITMAEPGVTSVVPVDLREYAEV